MTMDGSLSHDLRKCCECDKGAPCLICRSADEIQRLRAIAGFAILNHLFTPARLEASTGLVLDDDDTEVITEDAAEWMRQYRWATDNGTDPIHLLPLRPKDRHDD